MRNAQLIDWRRSAKTRKQKDYTIRRGVAGERTAIVKPKNIATLLGLVSPENRRSAPLRPLGAGSATTACNTAVGGTLIDMTEMTKVIEHRDEFIRVQAGLRIADLIETLSKRGHEVPGCLDLTDRTVGGAIASASFGPSCLDDGALFARNVIAMTVVTPDGKLLKIDQTRKELLNVFRMSYGLLGIIAEVTLKIRPARVFVRKHKRMSVEEFAVALDRLEGSPMGLKYYLMPFKGQVYTEMRRFDDKPAKSNRISWKLKDWGESTVLPTICGRLSSIVPISSVRYSLIDQVHGVGQSLLNNRLVEGGTTHDETLGSSSSRLPRPPLKYSTWCFPAADAGIVVQAYQAFCRDYYRANRFRCDMPAVGFRLAADRSALLSPSFDEPMLALRAISTPHRQWEDFALEYAAFARQWGGVPIFNQSVNVDMDYAALAYGSRLDFFRRTRRQLDPDNRLLNPFLAQYFH
ncbi:MAG: FAD-binding oxidoreductase [Pseudomonadota bacterium]